MAEKKRKQKRANGIESRNAILDAAAQIAGERGYEGTGIKAVSELSGLPASSIYWHFADKDALIAAVIERSFAAWADAARPLPQSGELDRASFIASFRESAQRLEEFPDFLRLGLMLMLERRPDEPTARQRFEDARALTRERIAGELVGTFGDLDAGAARRLSTLILAASDGLFIAADNGDIDLADGFTSLAEAIWGAINLDRRPTPEDT